MHGAEHPLGFVGGLDPLLPVGDVEPDRVHRQIGVLEAGHGLIQRVLPDVGDHHLHARACEHLGHAQAHA